jgi:hypothetical protein
LFRLTVRYGFGTSNKTNVLPWPLSLQNRVKQIRCVLNSAGKIFENNQTKQKSNTRPTWLCEHIFSSKYHRFQARSKKKHPTGTKKTVDKRSCTQFHYIPLILLMTCYVAFNIETKNRKKNMTAFHFF